MIEANSLTVDDLLKLRISVVFVRDKYTFFNTIKEFQARLKHHFQEEYSLDIIETALNDIEEQLLVPKDDIVEIPEDYELNQVI